MNEAKSASKKNLLKKIFIVAGGLLISYLPSYIHKIMDWANIQLGPDGPSSILIWNWLAVILLLSYIVYIEGRTLASILLIKPTEKDIEWAFWFFGIATTITWLAYALFPTDTDQGTNVLINYPLPILLGIIMTAAISEEILFRGYIIERLRELTGMGWLAVGVSFIIFVMPHITFFGPKWLLYHGIGTMMIYVLYAWRKNLFACMLLHLLINLPILLLASGIVANNGG